MNKYSISYRLLISIIILTSTFISALTLQGKIIDESNNPIIGANIYTQNTGVTTNELGEYTITVEDNPTLTISHLAFGEIKLISSDIPKILILKSSMLNGKEVIVNAGLGEESEFNTPSSIFTMSKKELSHRSENHFQGVINLIPNLNFNGGTSRPRYFQIRGIGERSQYTGEGAPNFSVGFMVDGVDYSGIGMTGVLFDAQQIEVFKGPQSSIYGPNAMAGLINITTAEPTPFITGNSILTFGSDNDKTIGYAVGGPIFTGLNFRIAMQKHTQDGFRENIYCNKTNTNKKDEFFYRTKLNWMLTDNIRFYLNHFSANLNNGYDVWAVDNNEDFITYTDQQGMDSQIAKATSAKIEITNQFGAKASYQFSTLNSEMEHSYDGDWANNDYWLEYPYNFDPALTWWEYSFYDKTIRNRDTDTHELRISSDNISNFSWILGYYVSETKESDDASGYLFGGDADMLNSEFKMNNNAFYAQISAKLNKFDFSLNFRDENQNTDYTSSGLVFDWDIYDYTELPVITEDINHSFSGGKFSVNYSINESMNIFTSISKGYKAGGINQNPNLSENSRFYEPEFNNNFELGVKYISENIVANFTSFMMIRTNQQVQISTQQEEGNPNSFYYFTSNASEGTNMGIEFDAKYKIAEGLILKSSFGLLDTHIESYEFWEDEETMLTLGNREQAMAPLYNFAFGAHYETKSGLFADVEFTGKDEYYFSDSHNQKSDAYQLLNYSTGYSNNKMTISFWTKNLLDTRYSTRGFYFGNEPIWNENTQDHDYSDKLYISYGDPLHYGVSLKLQF
jgi:iron complex outermembrane recepter protein